MLDETQGSGLNGTQITEEGLRPGRAGTGSSLSCFFKGSRLASSRRESARRLRHMPLRLLSITVPSHFTGATKADVSCGDRTRQSTGRVGSDLHRAKAPIRTLDRCLHGDGSGLAQRAVHALFSALMSSLCSVQRVQEPVVESCLVSCARGILSHT